MKNTLHSFYILALALCAWSAAIITNDVTAFVTFGVSQDPNIVMGAAGAELLKRYFLAEIQPLLFPSNLFISRAIDDSALVNNNSVELPHSGTIPGVTVNRGALPAPVSKRNDVATNYVLEELTTDPTLIQDSEALIVSYDKRASVLDLHQMALNDKACLRTLYQWGSGLTQANGQLLLQTNGQAAATRTASAPGSTKNAIKPMGKADIIAAKVALDTQNVPADGRCAVLTPAQYGDLLGVPEFSYFQYYGNVVLPSGVLQRALGFDLYVRAVTQVFTWSAGPTLTAKAEGALAVASTDVAAGLFWHPKFVRKAIGSIKAYVSPDRPEYYGSLFSMLVRFQAIQARNDLKGVVLVGETS